MPAAAQAAPAAGWGAVAAATEAEADLAGAVAADWEAD